MRQRAVLVVIVASGNNLANFIPPLMVGPWAPSITFTGVRHWWALGMTPQDLVSRHSHRAPTGSPREKKRPLLVLLRVGGKF